MNGTVPAGSIWRSASSYATGLQRSLDSPCGTFLFLEKHTTILVLASSRCDAHKVDVVTSGGMTGMMFRDAIVNTCKRIDIDLGETK